MSLRNFWRFVFVTVLVIVTRMTLTIDPDDTKTGFKFARFVAQILFNDPGMSDKVAHFFAYYSLGFAALLADLRILGRRIPVIALIALYGGFLELMQGAGGVRTPELADALANAGGAFSACASVLIVERLMRRRALA